ncbi:MULTISPECIES: ABC transporter permease [Bartonella]|uniref:Amino acid ABC transporter membrane protein 1, PAAT family n=1 Tax=Bartonella choladocola TaxID=2750995 RepID=A0A1U9MHB2_9HYPH|nr:MULTISPECIES: ABC transporter permease subunit [Bartonella]AQT47128.1 amino acid ABC transporter membrane protein 1, PAAT family [Bartonella choladocola]MBH9975296.1 ABC transporter permease subunit [Bartonella choladocola]MBI0014903.1 ABC transporter permease subunit [Bartonella sp. B10834G3]MBI0140478.1 ABC transporter permease subunit [Bartonella choladocola]
MIEYLSLLSFGSGGWGIVMLSGAGVTLSLALCCLPLGLPLGLVCAMMIQSDVKIFQLVATVFSAIFRGLPELLTLFLVYYGLQTLVQTLMAHFNINAEFSVNAFFAGVLALGTVFAAFSCEVWLGAFKVLDSGQYEAAKALSLSRATTFFRVILPQLARNALPGLSNNWLTLLKDTSLVSTITLVDIMRQTNLAVAATKQPMFFYSTACVIYLIFSAISSFIIRFMEKRANACYEKVSA